MWALQRRRQCSGAASSRLEGGQGHDSDAVIGLVAVAECGEHDEAGWIPTAGGVDLGADGAKRLHCFGYSFPALSNSTLQWF